MRTIMIGLVAMTITACRTAQPTSSDMASASSSKSLTSKLQKVACVKAVQPDRLMGTPESPVPAGATSGNLIVTVRDSAETAECVKDIQKAIPDIKIISQINTAGVILVSGDTKQASLVDKVKKADCAKYLEEEHLLKGIDGTASAKTTGNFLIGVKDDVTLDACVAKLKANGVTIIDTIKNLKIILVKSK